MSRPRINPDTKTLYELYRDYNTLRRKDIVEKLGCCETTAYRIMDLAQAKAKEDDVEIYNPGGGRLITVDMLFSLYGWEPEKIIKKAKLLIKEGKIQ